MSEHVGRVELAEVEVAALVRAEAVHVGLTVAAVWALPRH
jgi:hypothetical protein